MSGPALPPAVVIVDPIAGFEYAAPPECPAQGDWTNRVIALAASDRSKIAPLRLLHVSVEKTGSGWLSVVEMRRGNENDVRLFRGSTCSEVEEATAVVVAFALRANSSSAPADAPRVPATSAEPSTRPALVRPTPAEAKPANRSLTVFVGANGGVAVGVLPSPAARGSIHVGAAINEWRVAARFVAMSPSDATSPIDSTKGAHIWALQANVELAYLSQFHALALGPSLSVGATMFDATGFGIAKPASNIGFGYPVEGALMATLRLGSRWEIAGRGGAGVWLARPEIQVEGLGSIHRPAAVFATFDAGVELHF